MHYFILTPFVFLACLVSPVDKNEFSYVFVGLIAWYSC